MSTLGRELARKLVHLLQLPIIGAYSLLLEKFSQRVGILFLTGLLLILLEIEYVRFDFKTRFGSRLTSFLSRVILRKHERNNLTGAVYFVTSAIISFAAFDYSIALAGLMMTVFGDLVSALAGTAFGVKKLFRNKSYIGTITGFMANLIVGGVVLPASPEVFVPMAFVATGVETLTQKLDDNLTVPLFAGFTGQALIVTLGAL